MPSKSKNKIPKSVSDHPSVAPFHEEWLLKESALDPVRRLNKLHKNYSKKLEALKQVEVAKTALDAAIARLKAPSDLPAQENKDTAGENGDQPCIEGDKVGSGVASKMPTNLSLQEGNGMAEKNEKHASIEADKVDDGVAATNMNVQNDVEMSESSLGGNDDTNVESLSGHKGNSQVDEFESDQGTTPNPDSFMESDGEHDHPVGLGHGASPTASSFKDGDADMHSVSSKLSTPPSSPAIRNSPLPTVDLDSIRKLQHEIELEERLRAETTNNSSDLTTTGDAPGILRLDTICPTTSLPSGLRNQAYFDTIVAAQGHNGAINPKLLSNVTFMQILEGQTGTFVLPSTSSVGGPSQQVQVPLAPPSPIVQAASVLPPSAPLLPLSPLPPPTPPLPPSPLPPPAPPLPPVVSNPATGHAQGGGLPPITPNNTVAPYSLPDPRLDICLDYSQDDLIKLRGIRAESYTSSAESIRARRLYEKHANSMCPNNADVENELLSSIPSHVTSLNNWVIKGNYELLCHNDRIILQARGRAAIEAYVEDLAAAARVSRFYSAKKEVIKLRPSWVRILALRYACYLPEAATTSRDVALEFLRDTHNQVKCPNHHKQRAKDLVRRDAIIPDGQKRAGFVELAGVGQPYFSGKAPATALGPHIHCGCSRNDALIEWFLFKTTVAHSTNPHFAHLEFHWEPDTIIPTHVRSFWVSTFRQLTGLDGDSPELYTGVAGWGSMPGQWASESQLADRKLSMLKHALTECLKDNQGIDVYPTLQELLGEQEDLDMEESDVPVESDLD